MTQKTIPSVVLIPFAQSRPDFFARQVTSVDELRERVEMLEDVRFDEIVVAYAEQGGFRGCRSGLYMICI